MADPAPGGIYPDIDLAAVAVEPADLRVEVLGRSPAGPAGEIAVELPDGSVWVVDHADPDRLVRLEVAGDDPSRSALLVMTIGGERALRVDDVARRSGRGGGAPLRPRTTAPRGWEALVAGRALLQLDLAADADLAPLSRLAAVAQVVDEVVGAPVGVLLDEVVAARLHLTPALAAATLDELRSSGGALPGLPPGVLEELGEALFPLAAQLKSLGADPFPVTSLARQLSELARELWAGERVDSLEERSVHALALDDSAVPSAASLAAAPTVAGPPSAPWLEVVAPGHGRVHAPGAGPGDWVAVLRAEGLAPLARVPLRADGAAVPRAHVVLPPLLGPADVVLHLVPPTDLPRATGARPGLDSVRRAVRAGRRAARFERAVGPDRARTEWRECAGLWEEAGDQDRADAARRRAGGGRPANSIGRVGRGRRSGPGLLSDAVAVTLDDG